MEDGSRESHPEDINRTTKSHKDLTQSVRVFCMESPGRLVGLAQEALALHSPEPTNMRPGESPTWTEPTWPDGGLSKSFH